MPCFASSATGPGLVVAMPLSASNRDAVLASSVVHAGKIRVGLRNREARFIQLGPGRGRQRDVFGVLRGRPKAEHGTGGHTHGAVRNARGGVGQSTGQYAQVIAVQLRYHQHTGRGQVGRDSALLGEVLRPCLRNGDASRRSHDKRTATVNVVETHGGFVHFRQLDPRGHRLSNHNGFDRVALLLGVFERIHPIAFGGDRCCDTRPAIATIQTGSGDLGFQVAGRNAQGTVQITVGIEGQQRAHVLGGGANKKEIALNLGHGPLAQIEIVDADFAECHAVPRLAG